MPQKSKIPPFKLSATSLSCYLESPKQFYWRYIKRLEPLCLSVADFDHDKIAGTLWSEFVDAFYRHVPEKENIERMRADWDAQTEGWCPEKLKERLTKALHAWAALYYQQFSPDDGVRNGSEKRVENERFIGYLDGLSPDETVIHEVKSTSRSKSVSEQLWKVQNSIQVKLYAVLTKAQGVMIEFAWKDDPYDIFRAPVLPITEEQLRYWEQELNALADGIYALGSDPHNYPCHSDGCNLITKNFIGLCNYQSLCAGIEGAEIAYKAKESRRK